MKQLYVIAPLYLFPPESANQKDIVGRIKLFQELGYEVTAFMFPLPHQKFDIAVDKNIYGLNIELLEREADSSFREYRLHKLWYKSRELINNNSLYKLNKFILQNNPDVLWFEYSSLSPLAHAISKIYKGQIIFRYHNYELKHYLEKVYISWKGNLGSSLSVFIGAIPNIIGILRCDRLMFSVAKRIACISTKDLSYFKQNKNVVFLPYSPPDEIVRHENNINKKTGIDVFYFGSDFANNINRSGLDFIAKKIIPLLKRQNINFITFHILGKNLPEGYRSLDILHLKLHGFVDDLNKVLEDMDVAIVPIFYGMGFKVKAYESLKRGFPVVATKRSLSNFNGAEGSDYLVAHKPQEFVDKITLLKDPGLREKLGNNAFELVERDFSEEITFIQLKYILS
ncbi:glycosyltransferase [Chloroflexota bacterium]